LVAAVVVASTCSAATSHVGAVATTSPVDQRNVARSPPSTFLSTLDDVDVRPAVAPSGDWPTFQQNPLHSGVQTDRTVGASSAARLSLKWKSLANPFKNLMSSPVVAFNAAFGKRILYSATGAGVIAARELDTGEVVWTSPGHGAIVATPSVLGNTVYVGTEAHTLLALDATTGKVQCRFSLSGAVISSPVVGFVDATGPVVFFGDTGTSEANNAGHEWAVNGVSNTNGACTQKWAFNAWTDAGPAASRTGSWSPPALTTDSTGRPLVVFGSADPDNGVYALDARDGSLVWRFQTTVTAPDQDVGAAPTISAPGANGNHRGVVYIDGKDKFEFALDLLTGAKIWQVNLKKAAGGDNANAQSAAALIGDRIVVPYGRYLFKFDAATGRQIWRSAAAPSVYFASPAISGASSDQVIIIGDAAGIEHAYRLHDGAQLFQFKTGGAIFSSAAVASGRVYFGANNGYLYALG
jgi:outer membrane protein assembly factor BamB